MSNSADSSSPPLLGYDTYAHYGRHLIQAFDDKLKPKDHDTVPPPPTIPIQLTASMTRHSVTGTSSVDLVGIPDAGQCSSLWIDILLTAVLVNYQTAADISSTNPVGILGAGQFSFV